LQAGAVPLELAFIVSPARGGTSDPDNLITLCPNCHLAVDRTPRPSGEEEIWSRVEGLSPGEQSRLLAWMALGRRPVSVIEQVWQLYSTAPSSQRDALKERLALVVSARDEGAEAL
jgi:hypothetical protein